MKKNTVLIFIVLAALAAVAAACTPTGGEPEAGIDPTVPATTDAAGADEEKPTVMGESGLEGTRWVLVSYLNAAGETVEALADREVTAEFGLEPGRMGGNAGCNSYFAGYTVDGANLTISEAGSTMMACEPAEVMQQEAEFLAALGSAATFTIDGDQLQIANAEGATALTFRGTEPAGLTGTNWTAVSVNNGLEAVTSVAADTVVTALFAEDGQLNGSAGCNTYMTSYTVDGNNITIQPPATTRKLCPEPEGIMEQEAAFVTMLPQAATYSISGNTLELRTADGALIASFTPGAEAAP
jgi:heat shock protein HslJ